MEKALNAVLGMGKGLASLQLAAGDWLPQETTSWLPLPPLASGQGRAQQLSAVHKPLISP